MNPLKHKQLAYYTTLSFCKQAVIKGEEVLLCAVPGFIQIISDIFTIVIVYDF